MQAGHRLVYDVAVRVIERVGTLSKQGSLRTRCQSTVRHLIILSLLIASKHTRFPHVLRIEVAMAQTWNVRRHLPLLDNCLPVNVCAPGVIFYSSNLTLCYPPSWVLVQHESEQICKLLGDKLAGVL